MLSDFLHELEKRFTGELRTDAASKILYSTDASIYQIEPLGVAIPKTQDDLHAAVELAAKYKIPILPRGAGSSLAGQAIGEVLIVDCSRYLDRLLNIDAEAQTAIVEPGVVLADLNRAAAQFGLMYGPDPASAERATMGGVIGNNATGAHSILYGMSADHLISADVILANGSLSTWGEENSENQNSELLNAVATIREKYADLMKQNFPKSWRNSAGYRINYLLPYSPTKPPQWNGDYPAPRKGLSLAPLLAGSEGTLAVMRRATVNLVKKPKHTILGILAYESVAASSDDAPRLLALNPSAVELIPQLILRLARHAPAFARQIEWLRGDPSAVLVVEFSGDDPRLLKEQIEKIGKTIYIAETREEQTQVWNVRKAGLGILDSRPREARPVAFIEDCAVPVERLGAFVRGVESILAAHKTEGGMYAHTSGGCLHIRPILNLYQSAGAQALRSISEQVFQLTVSLGGSMSSEHGDGIARGEWIEKTYGSELAEAMRLIKRAADPHNILNPQKMLDAPPMDSHLRYGAAYAAQTWQPVLKFNHERGLAGAIEQCNGQGVCRKTSGVMCPSFQATREEANSTRGRANLLRGLISNPQLQNANYSASVFSALDLCLACKGCTSECPSGVDMPKLKYEFTHEYFKTHRRPLRDYLFGYFDRAAKILAPIAPLANAFMKMNWSRKWIARLAGITEKRAFPAFWTAKSPDFASENKSKVRRLSTPLALRKVLFLSDVFSRYLEPEVEQAAFDLLRAAGYEVKVLPSIGAGTSLLSKGFLEAAQIHAEKLVDEILSASADSDLPVVCCEPPEISTLKHDYLALLPHRRADVESIVKRAWLLDEFLIRNAALSDITHAPQEKQVFFHPHCHQRAEPLAADGQPSGTAATAAMLRACGYEVEISDAGCCGMAGTFGYDAEHYDLSMQVGELKLLPAVRKTEKIVASSGSACRLQIEHGANKRATHPLLLISCLLLEEK
ncbi:MAG: FAD-binding and (Fe-S)-binding domain-containing protein [Anaerolineales bacterium]